jgi:hypothetical protein
MFHHLLASVFFQNLPNLSWKLILEFDACQNFSIISKALLEHATLS